MNQKFTDWLKSDNRGPIFIKEGHWDFALIRLEKKPKIDYLYYQSHYKYDGIRDSEFRFGGIYCKKDGLIYNVASNLTFIESTRYKGDTLEDLKMAVRGKVEKAIDNDRKNLSVTEITVPRLLRHLEGLRARARDAARAIFLREGEFEELTFRCDYKPDDWTEDSFLDYILNPEGYISGKIHGLSSGGNAL